MRKPISVGPELCSAQAMTPSGEVEKSLPTDFGPSIALAAPETDGVRLNWDF